MSARVSHAVFGALLASISIIVFSERVAIIDAARVRRDLENRALDAQAQERAHEDTDAAVRKDVPNTDRLQCLRQDDLDLIMPSDTTPYLLRKVIGINGDNTQRDVYVSATNVQIKSLNATLKLSRSGEHKFKFELTGPATYDGANVASVDFYLEGLKVYTKSTAIDWIASLAANRQALEEGQKGWLYFNLYGEAEAKWDEETKDYVVELVNSEVNPFQFEITSQYILQEALTQAGGIDQIIVDNLWPAIKNAIPKTMIQAFQFLTPEELFLSAEIAVEGGMKVANGPLELEVDVTEIRLDMVPARVLEILESEKFDFRKLAEEQVDRLLAKEGVQEAWKKSREAFIEQLGHFGFLFNKEATKKILETEDLESLRPELVKFARDKADAFIKGMQPFIRANTEGKAGFFQGLSFTFDGSFGWALTSNDGLFTASLGAPEKAEDQDGWKDLIHVPAAFLEVLGVTLPTGNAEPAKVGLEGFEFQRGSLKMSSLKMNDLQIKAGGQPADQEEDSSEDEETIGDRLQSRQNSEGLSEHIEVADVYKLNGEVTDVSLSLPQSLEPGVSLTCPKLQVAIDTSGAIAVSVSPQGMQVHQVFKEAAPTEIAGKMRTDIPMDKINGTLNLLHFDWDYAEVARPSEPTTPLKIKQMVPLLDVATSATISGSGHKLNAYVTAKGTLTVKVDDAMKYFLAPRPQEDFGYAFYTGRFLRIVEHGETHVEHASNVIAVVSCGYLRLLRSKWINDRVERLNMNPADGQLELDLSKYDKGPKIKTKFATSHEDIPNGYSCMVLYSNGYPARRLGMIFKEDVDEKLCGPPKDVAALGNVIALQLKRFKDSRAKDWNYGTHPADTPQYVLPNAGTVDLDRLVKEQRMAESVLQTASTEIAFTGYGDLATWDKAAISADRLSCHARETMDRSIFPPEQWDHKAIRMSVGGVDTIGDLYIALDKIQIADLDAQVTLGRKDDNTFTFEVVGTKQQSKASAHAWIEGLELDTPQTDLLGIVKGLADAEYWMSRIASVDNLFGDGHDRGRMDQGKVDVEFHLKGDFRRDKRTSSGWKVVEKTAVQDVDITFGEGGLMQALLNQFLLGSGGVKKMFFDTVWPLLVNLIPASWGEAFEVVPANMGQVTHTLTLKGWCENPDKQGRCDAEELRIDIEDVTKCSMSPGPIIQNYVNGFKEKLIGNGTLDTPTGMLENMVTAYQSGKDVFKDSKVLATAAVELVAPVKPRDPDPEHQGVSAYYGELGNRTYLPFVNKKALHVELEASVGLPDGFFESLAGEATYKMLADFVPKEGALAIDGSAGLKQGIIHLPDAKINKVRLPLVLGGETDAVELDATVKGFTLERVQAASDAPSIIFDKETPLDFTAPGFEATLNQDAGLTADFKPKLQAIMSSDWMGQVLEAATESLWMPASLRTGLEEEADGALPEEFQRPSARMPTKLDIGRLLKEVKATVDFKLTGASARLIPAGPPQETLEFEMTTVIKGNLALGHPLWKGLLDAKDKDFGYVHFSMPGFFGEMQNNGRAVPKNSGMVMLACGTLDIYTITSKNEEPFQGKAGAPTMSLDLRKAEVAVLLSGGAAGWSSTLVEMKSVVAPRYCLHIHTEKNVLEFWSSGTKQYFCGEEAKIRSLQRAIKLQIKRFSNVAKANKKYPKNKRGALPDGTWFKDLNPKNLSTWYPERSPPKSLADVKSPHHLWNDALELAKQRWWTF